MDLNVFIRLRIHLCNFCVEMNFIGRYNSCTVYLSLFSEATNCKARREYRNEIYENDGKGVDACHHVFSLRDPHAFVVTLRDVLHACTFRTARTATTNFTKCPAFRARDRGLFSMAVRRSARIVNQGEIYYGGETS